MLTNNLVAATSFSVQTARIIDLVAETVTNFTSLDYAITSGKPQLIACDKTEEFGYGLGFTTNQVLAFDGTLLSVSVINTRFLNTSNGVGYTPSAIISMGDGSGKFIVGTTGGLIVEIEIPPSARTVTAPLVNKAYHLRPPSRSLGTRESSTFPQNIYTMHYDSRGFLVVACTDGNIYLVNHETGTTLQVIRVAAASSSGVGPIISSDGGLTCISVNSPSAANLAPIVEWDIFRTPMKQNSFVYAPDTSVNYRACGIDGSKVWVANATGISKFYIYDLSGTRSTANHAVSANDAGAIQADFLAIDDSGGVGSSAVMFHTDISSAGQNIPLTTGISSLLTVTSHLEGMDEKFDIRRNTT
jgi:hypothetical protein